jgi:hypothetical protein
LRCWAFQELVLVFLKFQTNSLYGYNQKMCTQDTGASYPAKPNIWFDIFGGKASGPHSPEQSC